MTLGQYLQGQINSDFKIFLSFGEKCIPPVFYVQKTNCFSLKRLKKSIRLEILHRNISLKFDLRSAVKAAEVTKCQGLYSRFGDFL